MLWAYTHELADITHLFETICVEDSRFTVCSVNKASKNGDCCCLSSAIVTKQCENLATVHFHV